MNVIKHRDFNFEIPSKSQFWEQREIEINLVNIYSVTITYHNSLGVSRKIG